MSVSAAKVASITTNELSPADFAECLYQVGFRFGSGVPCSWLSPFTNALIEHPRMQYIPAVQEGDAVAIAAGADLGGARSLVAIQNSGLTNTGSPLTSYQYPFRRGVLLFVSLRGEEGVPDEPQHELMGMITEKQLALWDIEYDVLERDQDTAMQQIKKACEYLDRGKCYALVVKKGTFAAHPLLPPDVAVREGDTAVADTRESDELPSRRQVLEALLPFRDQGDVLLATTGYTGRELFELGDVPNQLMMVGSMGCVSSLALGLACAKPDRKIIAIDGDGALLMRLGSLTTLGWQRPSNVLHLLLDNGQHESTGGQPTASPVVSFSRVAAASGYPRVVHAHTVNEVLDEVAAWHERPTLTFVYIATSAVTSKDLSRPAVSPAVVAKRLREWLA